MYDDHVSPATAAQTLLCTAARKRKEVSPPLDRSLTPELLFTFTFQWSTPDFPRNAFRSDQNYLLEIPEGRGFQGKDSESNNLKCFIAGAVFCRSHIHIWFNCTFYGVNGFYYHLCIRALILSMSFSGLAPDDGVLPSDPHGSQRWPPQEGRGTSCDWCLGSTLAKG